MTASRLERWVFWALLIAVALYLSTALQDLRDRFAASSIKRAPVTNWIVVHDLSVPPFRVGEDPKVVFHRVVSEDLFGGWGVEVHNKDGEQVCSGTSGPNGGATYRVRENPSVTMAFSAYTGGCVLSRPGSYRMTVVLRVRPAAGGPAKPISFQSNWFEVRP